jgi:hypothetical protein
MSIPRRPETSPIPDGLKLPHHRGRLIPMLVLLHVARWVWGRRGTRLTPVLLVLAYFPGTPLAAFAFNWWAIAIVGGCISGLIWLTQRQIQDAAVDDDISEKLASQWSARSTVAVAACTVYLEVIHVGHAVHGGMWPFVSWNAFVVLTVTDFVLGSLLWGFLFTTGHVTTRRLTAQVQRTWLGRVVGTALEGSRVLVRQRTPFGERMRIDASHVRGLPSQLMSAASRESIAVRHRVPIERVQVKRDPGGDASKLVVEINHSNPWAGEVVHPLYPTFRAEQPRSILDPIILGADPTEHSEQARWIRFPIYTREGGRHILVLATTGGGKSGFVNVIVEHVTGCLDAEMVMMDASKGHDAWRWRWACKRVHVGEEALGSIVAELESAVNLIRARAQARRLEIALSASFTPSAQDKVLLLVLDEADIVLGNDTKGPLAERARAAVKFILSKGRSEGVILLLCAQRGTLDYLGKGDAKANASYRVLLRVAQTSETTFAFPDWRARGVPDMASYGEGRSGVFALVGPDIGTGGWRTGRACALYDHEIVEAIAMDRCRPEHREAMLVRLHQIAQAGHPLPLLAGGAWSTYLAEHDRQLPPLPDLSAHRLTPSPIVHMAVQAPPAATSAYGTPGSLPDDATDEEPPTYQASEAVITTARLVTASRQRGPVSIADLIAAAGGAVGVSVPPEVLQVVRALGERHGPSGFTRADLEGALSLVSHTAAKSSRWTQGVLRQLVEDGVLEAMGGGRGTRYRKPARAA